MNAKQEAEKYLEEWGEQGHWAGRAKANIVRNLLKELEAAENENEQLTEIIEYSGADAAEILQQLNGQE